MKSEKTLCCSRCGCEDILQPYLVEAGTKKIVKYMNWLDDYCPSCKASTRSTTIQEFYSNKYAVKCMDCKWVGDYTLLKKINTSKDYKDACPLCNSINIMNL